MELSKQIKKTPLQAITVGLAIAGVVVSISNFWLLNKLYPIERRVAAIEESLVGRDVLIQEFRVAQEQYRTIKADVAEIKLDIKEIKKAVK